MSDDKQVNQPQNDVQEAEVKQTQTDETKQSNTCLLYTSPSPRD